MEKWSNYEYSTKHGLALCENLFTGFDKVRLQHFIIDEMMIRVNAALIDSKSQCVKEDMAEEESLLKRTVGQNLPLVMERNFLSNEAVFIRSLRDRGEISELDYSLLSLKSKGLFETMVKMHNLKPLFIHLRDSPANCLKRVRERARPGEETVSLEYLSELCERLDGFYEEIGAKYPTVIIELADYEAGDGSGRVDKKRLLKKIFLEMSIHFFSVYFPKTFQK